MASNAENFRGYTFKQMLLGIIGLALVVRVVLLAVPGPGTTTHTDRATEPASVTHAAAPPAADAPQAPSADASIVEVMPFSLHGNVPAPLIASILRQHRPELTDQHAGDLMDTLPPGSAHRMIVILPENQAAAEETF